VLDATLTAHGLRNVGEGHFEASGSYGNPGSPSYGLRFELLSRAAVRLDLPRGTKTFGVRLGDVPDALEQHCSLSMESPQRDQPLNLNDHDAQLATQPDGSDLPWVELELRCPNPSRVEIAELLLAPARTPSWRRDEDDPTPQGVPPTALPAPKQEGAAWVWNPPVPLAHSCSDKAADIALAAARSPAVMLALGLRPGVDDLENDRKTPSNPVFQQRLEADGVTWKVEGTAIRTVLLDGYMLERVEALGVQRQLTVPKGKLLSLAAAQRIVRKHSPYFKQQPEPTLRAGKPVYAFDMNCRTVYVDARSGDFFEGPFRCVQ
jgi:hypothetical protein